MGILQLGVLFQRCFIGRDRAFVVADLRQRVAQVIAPPRAQVFAVYFFGEIVLLALVGRRAFPVRGFEFVERGFHVVLCKGLNPLLVTALPQVMPIQGRTNFAKRYATECGNTQNQIFSKYQNA